jgi:hypothetical protein
MIKILLFTFLIICISQFTEENIKEFWDKEKMKSAKPFPLLLYNLSSPKLKNQKNHLYEHTEIVPLEEYPNSVYKTSGKFFFEFQGELYSCSGTSVGNKIVLTAGHCISTGKGQYYEKFLFCPQVIFFILI